MPSKKRSADSEPVLKGWRVDLLPGRAAVQEMDGTVRLPVRVTRDGRHRADTDLVLTPPEAALLGRWLTGGLPRGPRSLLQELSRGHVVAAGPGVTVVSKLPR
ncbi:hypothetical protein ACIP88_20080 [Streptomyces uncialis]|uniref:hypothetical protein n=1 Tax=Streptomyces uncialis TaxID=1048205 RepID=UPI003818C8A1